MTKSTPKGSERRFKNKTNPAIHGVKTHVFRGEHRHNPYPYGLTTGALTASSGKLGVVSNRFIRLVVASESIPKDFQPANIAADRWFRHSLGCQSDRLADSVSL